MINLTGTAADLAWPFAILMAWLAGEFAFKFVVGLTVFRTSGNIGQAIYSSRSRLAASVAMGALFGVVMSALLRKIRHASQDRQRRATYCVLRSLVSPLVPMGSVAE